MPDHLKKHGNICHSAGPRKVPRWEAGNRVTVRTSEKSLPLCRPHDSSGKRTLLLFILPRHTAPLPPPRGGGGRAVMPLTCFPLHRGTATPPRPWCVGSFNKESARNGWHPRWWAPWRVGAGFPQGESHLCAEGDHVTKRDCDRQ